MRGIPSIIRVHRQSNDFVASLKTQPEDFYVEELWHPEFSGKGEHLYLFVEKRGQNTVWVAEQLAKACAVPAKHVGFSGLKDRQAVTRQWFSLPAPTFQAGAFENIEGVKVLQSARHHIKLRRGTHQGNRFEIWLRDFQGQAEPLEKSLQAIRQQGFPNYFGEQRFGHDGNNVRVGIQLSHMRKLVGHAKRGIYLSAMRSALFNQVLAAQIEAGNWPAICQSEKTATGPMWGRGRPKNAELGADVEARVVATQGELCDILEHGGLAQERRALREIPKDFQWSLEAGDLHLKFSLSPGSYATVLVGELVEVRDQSLSR